MGEDGSSNAFFAARPSFTVDGREAAALSDGVLTLVAEETTAGLYRCEATFGNWGTTSGEVDYLYFDRQLFDFGKSFAVDLGDGDAGGQVFSGRITGMEGVFPQSRPPELLVLAEDRLQDLRMTRRTRTFTGVTDADVMNQIASDHSLRAEIDVDEPTHDVLAQLNQSDLAFLRERARAIDSEVWVDDDTLHAQARARRDDGDVRLTYGQSLIQFSVLADLAQQRTSLTVSGWDVAVKNGVEYEATQSAIQSELNGSQSGASLLHSAFGDRCERITHLVPFDAGEAQSLAQAHFRAMARRFVVGRGVATGDARIKVGARVTIGRLGTLFDGEYTVTETRHTFDGQHGYHTRFTVERPGLGAGR
jgi:hypothetical protein